MFLSNWLVFKIVLAAVTGLVDYPLAADVLLVYDNANKLYLEGNSIDYVSNVVLYKGETSYEITTTKNIVNGEETILTGSLTGTDRLFGMYSAFDGNYLYVGGRGDNGVKYSRVDVFEKNNGTWSYLTSITGDNTESSDNFGWKIGACENYLIVGAYTEDTGGGNTGAAYVFKRTGATWTQQEMLKAPSPASGTGYGDNDLAINGDYAFVGASGDGTGGEVFVYKRSGTSWNHHQTLVSSDISSSDDFGEGLDLSGNYLVVGAPGENSNYGALYIFKNIGGTWTQQQKLVSTVSGNMGRNARLSIDGDYIVTGGHQDGSDGLSNSGAVYIFKKDEGVEAWTQQATLRAPTPIANGYFGSKTRIKGKTVIVGQPNDGDNGTNAGAVYIYQRSGTTWSFIKKFYSSDIDTGDQFGTSVSISENDVFVSAMYEDSQGSNAGKGYIYPLKEVTNYYITQPGTYRADLQICGIDYKTNEVEVTGTPSDIEVFTEPETDFSTSNALFSQNGFYTASGSSDATYLLVHPTTTSITVYKGTPDNGYTSYYTDSTNVTLNPATMSHDGLYIVKRSSSNTIDLYKHNTSTQTYVKTSGKFSTPYDVYKIGFLPNSYDFGYTVTNGSNESVLYLHKYNSGDTWDTPTSINLTSIYSLSTSANYGRYGISFSKKDTNGNCLLAFADSFASSNELYILNVNWNTMSTSLVRSINTSVSYSWTVSFTRDGVYLWIAQSSGATRQMFKSTDNWVSYEDVTSSFTNSQYLGSHTTTFLKEYVIGAHYENPVSGIEDVIRLYKWQDLISPTLTFDGYNQLSLTNTPTYTSSKLTYGSNVYDIGTLTSDITIEKPGEYASLTFDTSSNVAYFSNATVGAMGTTLADYVVDTTIYGTVQSGQTHQIGQGGFGNNTILNADGTRLLITDPLNYPSGRGRAYIYHLENGSWVLKQTWDNPNNTGQRFADGACMNEDGTRIFLMHNASEKVYTYEYTNGAWPTDNTGTHVITVGTNIGAEYEGLACNKAGDVLLMGHGNANTAYIYRRASATSWSQDSGGSFTKGRGVAMNGDGTRAFIGNSTDGTVHMTEWNGSTWSSLTQIIDESYSNWPCTMMSDSVGETLVIVSGNGDSSSGNSGIYERDSGTGLWSRAQGVNADTEIYGMRLPSISYDGTMVLVGSFRYDSSKGRAQLWQKSNGAWTLKKEYLNPDTSPASSDQFGAGCGIARTTKDKFVIGMEGDDTAGTDYGSVYVYNNTIPDFISFDTYNKLSLSGLTNPTSKIHVLPTGAETTTVYDIGTATNIYIESEGTYTAEMKGSDGFALVSNVVGTGQISEPPVYSSATPTLVDPIDITDGIWSSLTYQWYQTHSTYYLYKLSGDPNDSDRFIKYDWVNLVWSDQDQSGTYSTFGTSATDTTATARSVTNPTHIYLMAGSQLHATMVNPYYQVPNYSPSLTHDTYNKLSIENITPTASTLRLGSNTYDIGTATDIYIEDTGTYEIETKDANTFALVSNVVDTVTQVGAYDSSATPTLVDPIDITDGIWSSLTYQWYQTHSTYYLYKLSGDPNDSDRFIKYDWVNLVWSDQDQSGTYSTFGTSATDTTATARSITNPTHIYLMAGSQLHATMVNPYYQVPNYSPSLTHDTYNKLSIENITPTASTLRLGSNTYDIGTATDIYIEDTGTYEIETKDANTFAFTNTTVSGTIKTIEPALVGGNSHLHALAYDGKLYAWGINDDGELGLGDNTNKTTPTLYSGPLVSKILNKGWSGGNTRNETSWIKTVGNDIYATGKGDTYMIPGTSSDLLSFTDVTSYFGDQSLTSNNVVFVGGGERSCVALTESGNVWTWGTHDSSLWNLGQGTGASSSNTPKQITFGGVTDNISRVAFGHDHGIALDTDGDVWFWGQIWAGGAGVDYPQTTLSDAQKSPHEIMTSNNIIGVSSTHFTIYAWQSDGTYYALGLDSTGPIGDGTVTAGGYTSWQKVEYFSANNITINEIYTGIENVFADTSDGYYCWGFGGNGSFGNGGTGNLASPTKWTNVSNIKLFSAGGTNMGAAITEDGKYYAWGSGNQTQRGDNSTSAISYPKYIDTLPNILAPSFEFDGYDKVFVYNIDHLLAVPVFPNQLEHVSGALYGTYSWRYYETTSTHIIYMMYNDTTSAFFDVPVSAIQVGLYGQPDYDTWTDAVVAVSNHPNSVTENSDGTVTLDYSGTSYSFVKPTNAYWHWKLDPIKTVKFSKNAIEYDANKAQIVTISDSGTYDAQLSQGSTFSLKSTTIPATKASGLYTWAFHHGNFDNAYGDGDILTARDNGRFYADTPSYTGDIGTITAGSSTTSNTTYTFTPASTLTANVLMVAGGGGGGGRYNCGGGGAGGLVYTVGTTLSGTKTIVVGNGDSGGNGGAQSGYNGKDTTFTGLTTAVGGGYGGTHGAAGGTGGSGGGGGGQTGNGPGGSATSGQGFAGGTGSNSGSTFGGGGGGGGAGDVGGNGSDGVGGNGGIGKFFGTGSSYTDFGDEYGEGGYFASGAGGGSKGSTAGGIPGRGGGGYGARYYGYMGIGGSQHALPHTGGGGGGSGTVDRDQHPGYASNGDGGVLGHGGRGGSGIVLLQTNVALPNGSNTAVVQVGNPRRRSLPPTVDYMGSEVNRFSIIDGASMPTYKLPTHWYVDPIGSNSNSVWSTQGAHSLQKRADGGTSNVFYVTSTEGLFEYGHKMAQSADAIFMPVEAQRYNGLLAIGSNSTNDIHFEMAADGTAALYYDNGATLLSAGTIKCFTVGKWHHIALTVDSGGNAVGYVNGYPVVSGTYTSVAAVGSRSGNMHMRVGDHSITFRKFLTYEVSTYNFHMSPKQVLQRAAEVGLGPKLEYDGLNAINVVNAEPGSGTEITIYESNANDTSNLYVVSCNESSYLLSNAGTYYAQIKGTDTFTITRPLTVTDDHFPLYQYPPIDGTTTGLTTSTTTATWTISGVQYSTGSSVAGSPYNTFDNSITSGFDSTSSTGDITITFESSKTIRKYIVWPYDSTSPVSTPGGNTDPTLSTEGTSRPKSWVLYGTNNPNEWLTVLDTVTNQPPSIYGDVHSISSPASYQYYKLSVTANNGGSGLKIGEWQLWGDA